MKELKAIPIESGTVHIDTRRIPSYVGENLAQVALRAIQKAYADPRIQADYQRWKAERQAAVQSPEHPNT